MRATYFDGRTAIAHDVEIQIDADMFVVSGEGIDRRDPIGAVEITDAIGATPRMMRFVGGASCQVLDTGAFGAFLNMHGIVPSRVSAWERSWRGAGISLLLLAALVTTGYFVGLPLLAKSAADRLPDNALTGLSDQIQRALDRTVFSVTAAPGARLAAVLTRFDDLQLPGQTKKRLRVDFRKAPVLGANAMALPSGTIFVTDDLLVALPDDRQVMAILAHEAGHVDKRHGLRKIIQSSVTGILVTWYIGDISAIAAAAPTALMQAKYSRDLEREADAYAVDVLRLNHMPPSLLADALEGLERSRAEQGKAGESRAMAYLSTHPATSERLVWLRSQH